MQQGTVTLIGTVVTDIRSNSTVEGHDYARFRMAVQPRRYDRNSGAWVDQPSSFLSVVAWRRLAENVAASVRKGDPVLVSGRLRVREWEHEGRRWIDVEVDATSIGHDLGRGTSAFQRQSGSSAAEQRTINAEAA